MNFEFINSGKSITLPKDTLLNKIGSATETEVKVLFYAAVAAADNNGSFDENLIQSMSGLDLTEIILALQYWRGAEVLTINGKATAKNGETTVSQSSDKALQKNDTPTYTGEEIAKLFEEKAEIKLLIDECQRIAGKMFNPHEINKIVSLYDYLGLSCEYIITVYDYCRKKNKTTVHYVEKTAFNLYNEGIDTDEKLREYFKNKEEFESFAGNIRRIFGIGNRAFTKKEETVIQKCKDIYKFPIDMIEYAYELTINNTTKPSIPYMGKILDNWFACGYTTLEQVKEAGINHKKTTEKQNDTAESSFDNDEFFEAALKRSYDNIGKKPS